MIVKKKGFTLIELLTVIAILAIILLISAPIILNVLEKSKKNNFRNQALLYVDGLKQNALLDSMSDNPNIVLPEVGKSLSINISDITMDSNTNVTGNIVVTNKGNGNYSYILYITNGEYIICNKEYNKVTTNDIKKGNTCGDSLLYPTISNKYQTQTYNYKYSITKELILNGVSATDTRDGDITNKITYTGSVDTSRLGDYEIIYSVENSLGNISTTKRTIQVKDTEAPTITNTILKEEIDKGSTYNKYLEGITVKDNYDTGLEATYICKNGILQTIECSTIGSKAGVYYIIYDATDSSNNKYSETSGEEVKREIVVKDIDAPLVTLNGEATVTIEVGSTFTEPGYTAIDDEDGDVTSKVETSSNLNTRVLGTYTVQYIVVDSAGNRGIQTRTIQVVDTVKPTITNVTGNPSNWVTSATLTVEATDNYKLHVTAYSFDNGVTWQTGNSKQFTSNGEVNINVRDESGNISEVSTVNITKIGRVSLVVNNNDIVNNDESGVATFENIDTSFATNISCNNEAKPSLNGATVRISNIKTFTKCYVNTTLSQALEKADTSVNTIIMINDETMSSTLTIQQPNNIVLDLNGHILSSNTTTITNYGRLVIDSSKPYGSIKTTGENVQTIYNVNMSNGSKLTLKNGYIEGGENCNEWWCTPIFNHDGNLEITPSVNTTFSNDGSYINGVYVESHFGINTWVAGNSIAVINGGVFKTNNWEHLVCSSCNSMTINYATTIGTATAIRGQATGTININDGIFTSVEPVRTDFDSNVSININGGKFRTLNSENSAIINHGLGTIKICGGTIENSNTYDLYNGNTGYIYYTDNLNLQSGNKFDYSENNPTHIILENNLICK